MYEFADDKASHVQLGLLPARTAFCGVSFSADQREAKALESELKRLKEKSTDVLSVDTFSVSY